MQGGVREVFWVPLYTDDELLIMLYALDDAVAVFGVDAKIGSKRGDGLMVQGVGFDR